MNPACGTALVNHLMMLCRAILPLQPRLSSLNPLDADVTEVHSHPKGLAQVFFSNCVVKVRRGHDLDKMVTLSRIGPVKLCNIQSSGRIASDESLLPAFLFLSWMSSLEQFAPEQLHNKSQWTILPARTSLTAMAAQPTLATFEKNCAIPRKSIQKKSKKRTKWFSAAAFSTANTHPMNSLRLIY
jgi:hypothetical protein